MLTDASEPSMRILSDYHLYNDVFLRGDVLATLEAPLAVVTLDGKLLFANEALGDSASVIEWARGGTAGTLPPVLAAAASGHRGRWIRPDGLRFSVFPVAAFDGEVTAVALLGRVEESRQLTTRMWELAQQKLAPADEAVVLLNAAGVVDWCNERFERMFGASCSALKGRELDTVWRSWPQHLRLDREVLREKRMLRRRLNVDAYLPRATGPLNATLEPLYDDRDERLFLGVLCRFQAMQAAISRTSPEGGLPSQAGAEAATETPSGKTAPQAANETVSMEEIRDLAAYTAHEIRNPLTAIRGYLQLIERVGDERVQGYVHVVIDELDRVNNLTGFMLAISRPDTSPDHALADLGITVATTVDVMSSIATDKGVRLVLQPITQPLWIEYNEDQIKQVLLNIIKNALEVTAPGGVVEVRVVPGREVVRLEVEDNGVGVDPSYADKIFEPYFTTKTGGAGLGLALCRRYVQAHGGDVTIESTVGRGTLCTVLLPRKAPAG